MASYRLRLVNCRDELRALADIVRAKADSDKDALGFLAAVAYQKAAINEKLIVAVDPANGSYKGHIFFGGVFPDARVFQVFVDADQRRRGVASALFAKLFEILNAQNFTQVTAKVAADLPHANFLYEQMGFAAIREIEGGKTRGRKIILQRRDLDAPTLFSYAPKPLIANSLNIPECTTARAATYLVDLNVIFDAVRDRLRSEAAGTLMRAAWKHIIRVAVSAETHNELKRTAKDDAPDPLMRMMEYFWVMDAPSRKRVDELSGILAPIVFPERHSSGILTPQDKSDLVHLITAIENQAAGFITSENKILAASNYFRIEHGIDVISLYDVEELVRDDENQNDISTEFEAFTDNFLAFRSTNLHNPTIQNAIRVLHVESRFLPTAISSPGDHVQFLLVTDKKSRPLGFAWWTGFVGPTPRNEAYVTADEASAGCEGIVNFLCDQIVRESCSKDVSLVNLMSDREKSTVREFLLGHGFRASSGKHSEENTLQKVCIGQPIHRDNWIEMRLKVSNAAGGVLLPLELPTNPDGNSLIEMNGPDGTSSFITHQNLEQLLSPTLLISKGRDGVIVPITRSWADDLFGTHEQSSLLRPPEAIVRRERVYFSTPGAKGRMQPGKVVLFYESGGQRGGRMAVITVGRITQSNIVSVKDIEDNLLRQGVIDRRTLQTMGVGGK